MRFFPILFQREDPLRKTIKKTNKTLSKYMLIFFQNVPSVKKWRKIKKKTLETEMTYQYPRDSKVISPDSKCSHYELLLTYALTCSRHQKTKSNNNWFQNALWLFCSTLNS